MDNAPGIKVLKIDALVTGYGKKRVVNGVTLDVAPGEIVALIGHNGAGKSTLLKAIFGMLPLWEGRLWVGGKELKAPTPRVLLRAGVAMIPQGNRVFTDLSVRDNLEMGGVTLRTQQEIDEGIERVFAVFPPLKARLLQCAGTLSGGERQMLALANALVLSPRLLLLDEPSLGLAPPLVTDLLRGLEQIANDNGVAILIVEQKVREVLKIARRVFVLRSGVVSFSGSTSALRDETKLRDVYLCDPIPRTKEMAPKHGVHHEAGHAIAIRFFDLRIKHVCKLPAGKDTFEVVVADEDKEKLTETVEEYVFDRNGKEAYFWRAAFMAAAGPVAGRIYENDWDQALSLLPDDKALVDFVFRRDSKNDWDMIAQHLERGGVSTPEAMSLVRQLCQTVHQILESRWEAVTAVATELQERDYLSGDRTHEIVERALKAE